jgi:hypothetical protein
MTLSKNRLLTALLSAWALLAFAASAFAEKKTEPPRLLRISAFNDCNAMIYFAADDLAERERTWARSTLRFLFGGSETFTVGGQGYSCVDRAEEPMSVRDWQQGVAKTSEYQKWLGDVLHARLAKFADLRESVEASERKKSFSSLSIEAFKKNPLVRAYIDGQRALLDLIVKKARLTARDDSVNCD